jgi:hypothetical protein
MSYLYELLSKVKAEFDKPCSDCTVNDGKNLCIVCHDLKISILRHENLCKRLDEFFQQSMESDDDEGSPEQVIREFLSKVYADRFERVNVADWSGEYYQGTKYNPEQMVSKIHDLLGMPPRGTALMVSKEGTAVNLVRTENTMEVHVYLAQVYEVLRKKDIFAGCEV